MRPLAYILPLVLVTCSLEIDPNGYIVFCPCMGRFGNQVDQLLGAMQFSQGLNRTMVLPNFIEYPFPRTEMVPFENIFQVPEVSKFHRVIRMLTFTRDIMPKVWPKENRTALCWSPRKSVYDKNAPAGCHPKDGNPFGPYWDRIGVSFVHDAYFGDIPGGYDLSVPGSKTSWLERFPPNKFPVLAFPSPPAPFPSRASTWNLQRYLKWSSNIMDKALQFIKDNLGRPYVGIHLRNNDDWDRVCELTPTSANQPLFASRQCAGDELYDFVVTKEMCLPPENMVVEQVVETVKKVGAQSIFVASDKDFMIDALSEALKVYEVKVQRLQPDDAFVSLAILGQADHFIGNCVSTFSHIVRRERDVSVHHRPTSYFGVGEQKQRLDL